MTLPSPHLIFSLLLCGACSDVASTEPEELVDPGPRDASYDAALSFDGVDDYATTGTASFPKIDLAQTQMLWVKPAAEATGRQCLLVLRLSAASGSVLALEDGVPVAFNIWGPRDLARAQDRLSPGQWYHLAVVLDATSSKLYVDGTLSVAGPPPATNRTPTLGFIGSMDGYVDLFRGEMDEARIYGRAFSDQEVAAAAAGERADTDQLLLYLPFDEAAGARSYDRSGLGNHAALGDGIPGYMPARVVSDAPGATPP